MQIPTQKTISNQIRAINKAQKSTGIKLQYFCGCNGFIKIRVNGMFIPYHEAVNHIPQLREYNV